jgi:hypothetical protein
MKKNSFLGLMLIVFLLIAVMVTPVAAKAPEVLALPQQAAVAQEAATTGPIELIAELVIGAGALMWFVTGLVTYAKKLGARGKWLTVIAFLLGVGIGGTYKVLLTPPINALDWFLAVLFGLGIGLIATGVYDSYGNKPDEGAG